MLNSTASSQQHWQLKGAGGTKLGSFRKKQHLAFSPQSLVQRGGNWVRFAYWGARPSREDASGTKIGFVLRIWVVGRAGFGFVSHILVCSS